MHFLFLKNVSVPCQVSKCTPIMEPWPKREEKLVLSPLWWRSPTRSNWVSPGRSTVLPAPLMTQATPTSVGEPPAVFIPSKQAAERVVVLVQVYI